MRERSATLLILRVRKNAPPSRLSLNSRAGHASLLASDGKDRIGYSAIYVGQEGFSCLGGISDVTNPLKGLEERLGIYLVAQAYEDVYL
jgi:hypothetical protein